MKKILSIITFSWLVLNINAQGNYNYIETVNMLDSIQSRSTTNIMYYDGFGRPVLNVSNGIGGNGNNVYTLQTYDNFDRIDKKWLPVADNSLDCYDENQISAIAANTYSDNYAYSTQEYDTQNRAVSSSIAGKEWNDKDKKNVYKYIVNGDDVKMYVAPLNSDSLLATGYYACGTLTGETSIDADGHTITVYEDMSGHKILERRAEYNDTYFVYNDLGQLRFVLSPEYQKSQDNAIFTYEYRYDKNGRVIKKILPGCKFIQYWYDKAGRLTFMQDDNLRQKGIYRFMLYDNLNRMMVQGTCHDCMRDDNLLPLVTYSQSSDGVLGTGYELNITDLLTEPSLELVNYYDNYGFLSTRKRNDFPNTTININAKALGLQTGSIALASNDEYIYHVMSYDIVGNLTDAWIKELGGITEHISNSYTFTQQLKNSNSIVEFKNGETFSTKCFETYNKYNDKISKRELLISYNNFQSTSTIEYLYDNLGRLFSINRPDKVGDISYNYDIHGWTTDILTNSFNEHISSVGANSSPCYNGNISNITWQNGHNNLSRGYNFTYDGLNRMTNATYQEGGSMSSGANKYNEGLEYDENGNPTHIKRNGKMQDGNYGTIDILKLTYHGNQLLTVDDTAPMNLNEGAFDFKNNSKYQYDGTGALVSNSGKGIAYIEYTDNNMPKRIQFTNGNVTSYVYTSTGQKLRTIHYTAVPNMSVAIGNTHKLCNEEILCKDSTDYFMDGKLILKNDKVDMYCFDGGFCSLDNNNSRKQGLYYYNKDHLGNNREVVAVDGTIAQTNNYYPFGAPFNEGTSSSSELQPYKYNGKELDRMHGLDTYDYGARNYDAVIPTWTSADPLCEKYYNLSPYVYCANNPINAIDPDGRDWYRNGDGTLLWSPSVNSQKDLQKGFTYVGKEYFDEKNGISYRNDGSIYYKDEKAAYNRMWYMANKYWRTNKNKSGREESAFVLRNGAVLVLPDNWNDCQSAKHVGYERVGNYIVNVRTKEKIAFLGEVHTHQAGGDKGLSRTRSNDDDNFCEAQPNKPVIVMEIDGHISAGLYHNGEFIPLDNIGSLNNVLDGSTPLSLTMRMIIKNYTK